MNELSHFDEQGAARMVDVSAKAETQRTATASAIVRMEAATLTRIRSGDTAKGDVLQTARLAGIMAAKKTADLIPLCHPLPLTSVTVQFSFLSETTLGIEATVAVFGRTGVEMEALVAVSLTALTIYDMTKAIDRNMTIEQVGLVSKSGGRSGDFRRTAPSIEHPT